MQEITIGEIIQKVRIKQNITKEQLSRCICSVTTLNRYETGERVPDKFMLDAIFFRLGKETSKIDFIVTEAEFVIMMQRRKIEKAIFQKEWERAAQYLKEYETLKKTQFNYHRKYIVQIQGKIQEEKESCGLAEECYLQVLEASNKEDCEEILKNEILSKEELETVFGLVRIWRNTDKPKFQKYVKLLKLYMDKRKIPASYRKSRYSELLLLLSTAHKEEMNYGIAYEYAKEAKEMLLKEFQIKHFREILEIINEIEEKKGILNKEIKDRRKKEIFALEMIEKTDIEVLELEEERKWQSIAKHL